MERKPGFFDYDGPFMRICQEFASFILTNILFILCCVPVITIGPALVALTHVSLQHWRKGLQHSVPRIFWQAFCQNLKQGSILTLLLIIVGGTSIMDLLWLSDAADSSCAVLWGVLFSASMLLSMVLVYLLPLLSMGCHSLWEGACDAFQRCILNWWRSLTVAITIVAATALSLAVPIVFLTLLPLILLIGFSMPAYLFCILLDRTLPEE